MIFDIHHSTLYEKEIYDPISDSSIVYCFLITNENENIKNLVSVAFERKEGIPVDIMHFTERSIEGFNEEKLLMHDYKKRDEKYYISAIYQQILFLFFYRQ